MAPWVIESHWRWMAEQNMNTWAQRVWMISSVYAWSTRLVLAAEVKGNPVEIVTLIGPRCSYCALSNLQRCSCVAHNATTQGIHREGNWIWFLVNCIRLSRVPSISERSNQAEDPVRSSACSVQHNVVSFLCFLGSISTESLRDSVSFITQRWRTRVPIRERWWTLRLVSRLRGSNQLTHPCIHQLFTEQASQHTPYAQHIPWKQFE